MMVPRDRARCKESALAGCASLRRKAMGPPSVIEAELLAQLICGGGDQVGFDDEFGHQVLPPLSTRS